MGIPYICTMETKGEYRGIPYESDSELYFLFWYFELENRGLAGKIQRGWGRRITNGLEVEFPVLKNGKVTMKNQTLLRPSEYTFDYWFIQYNNTDLIKMLPRGSMVVQNKIMSPLIATYNAGYDQPQVFIECKPDFDQNNMTRLFKINQKIMWDKHRIFVNLVKTNEFFEKTFTPSEYLKTRTGKDRKLNYKPRTLNEYLNG